MLKEELRGEQSHYENFIQLGHTVLDKTDADSGDGELVTKRLDGVNATWDALVTQLGQREAALSDVLSASIQFQHTIKTLMEWLPATADTVDALAAHTPAEQRDQLKVVSVGRFVADELLLCLSHQLSTAVASSSLIYIYIYIYI